MTQVLVRQLEELRNSPGWQPDGFTMEDENGLTMQVFSRDFERPGWFQVMVTIRYE